MPDLIAHSLSQLRSSDPRRTLEAASSSTGGSIGRLVGGVGGSGGVGGVPAAAARPSERRRQQRTLEESEGTEIYRHDEAEEDYYKGPPMAMLLTLL